MRSFRLGLHLPDSTLCVICTAPNSAKRCRQPQGAMAPRIPVRIKEVIYTLSPFEQTVLSGLWKDLPAKMKRKWNEVSSTVCASNSPGYAFNSVAYSVSQQWWCQLTGSLPAALDGCSNPHCTHLCCHVVRPGLLPVYVKTRTQPGFIAVHCCPGWHCPRQAAAAVPSCISCAQHSLKFRLDCRYAADYKEKEKMHHRF